MTNSDIKSVEIISKRDEIKLFLIFQQCYRFYEKQRLGKFQKLDTELHITYKKPLQYLNSAIASGAPIELVQTLNNMEEFSPVSLTPIWKWRFKLSSQELGDKSNRSTCVFDEFSRYQFDGANAP